MKTPSFNKLTSAGFKVKIWIADWFDFLKRQKRCGFGKETTFGHYLIEIWKSAGMIGRY
ncbi:putative rossmann-like alpha/beta/alpha sandwich protein [Helianthus annuus]|nr:putative rossmann-like alpha/beta/alpha sandwich protein [Helianthus annuus]